MSIRPVEQRLDAMLADQSNIVEPSADNAPVIEAPADMQPIEPAIEPEQVAGLGTAIVQRARVLKQGLMPDKPPVNPADAVIAQEAQAVVTKAAEQAEATGRPGAYQFLKERMRKPAKPKEAGPAPAQADEIIPPATAAQVVEEAAAVQLSPAAQNAINEAPGLVIQKTDPRKVEQFLGAADEPADVGIDFNFNYIQGPEDIDRAINATSRIYADEIAEAKRGVVSDAALKDMAARLNIGPELLQMRVGQTLNAEQLLAARHLLVRSATKLDDLSKQIKTMEAGKEDDKLLFDFRNQLATHAAIQMRLKAAQTETARALRSFRLPVDGSTGLDAPQIDALMAEMGGRKNLKQMAAAFDQLSTDQKARFVEMAGTTSQQIGKIWREVYTSALMYGPPSVERALYGNMVLTLSRSLDSAFGSTVGKAVDRALVTPIFGSKASDDLSMTEAVIEMSNFFISIPHGLKAGLKAFWHDAPQYGIGRDVDKLPDPALSAKLFADPNTPVAQAVDYMGKAVRLPFRAMLAVDEFSKAQIAMMETRSLAARDALTAMRSGVDDNTALNGMAAQIASPDARTLDRVNSAVLEGTLQSELGGIGKALMNIRSTLDRSGMPIGTVLAPFIKSVVNAEKELAKRTPLALAMKEVREDLAAGGARRQEAIGRIAMGGSFMGYAAYLATTGVITGSGPTDPERRKFLRETTGWQPYSIKVGDKYYSYAGLEPIGGLLAVAATIAEVGAVYGRDGDDEWSDLLLYSAMMPFKYIGELPFMSSMSKFAEMIETNARDPKGEAAQTAAAQFFGGIGSTMLGGVTPIPVPAIVRQIENYNDPTKREVTPDPSLGPVERQFDFLYRSWAAKTPILSESIKPSRNVWGEEVKTGDNNSLNWLFPFNKTQADLDPVEQKLIEIARERQKMPLNKPERTIANIRLNDNEYSDMLLYMNQVTNPEYGNRTFKQAVASALVDPELVSQMNRQAFEGVAGKLSEIASSYKKIAIESVAFRSAHPDAYRQIKANEAAAKRKFQQPKREPIID